MPKVTGTSLSGNQVQLPDAAKGHPALIIVGFSHDSQAQTKQWDIQAHKQFSAPPKLEIYAIAVLQDAPRFVRGMIVHSMKGSVPSDEHDHYLTVVEGENDLKGAAKFEKADEAYLLLIDANGEIQWRGHGPSTDAAAADLAAHLKNLGLH